MYYRTPGNLNPILPRADLTPTNIADNFDERTVINDDLNMNGFFIYNLKNPEDDQDAVTKIYIDTKQYNINSANITGNLPQSRITIDSDINLGSYKITKNGQEIIGLSNNSVITSYIANNAVTNDKIQSLEYSKLTNIPTSTSVPIGGIILWSTPVIPTGFLECNGSLVDPILYPSLSELMTNVPDLRGVFVRGLDNNKGYDTGRSLGTYQTDTYASHSHTIQSSGSMSLSGTATTSTSGVHQHRTALGAQGDDGTFGNTFPIGYNEGITGNPNNNISLSYTSWDGNHDHTVSLTVTGGNHNHGGATGNSGSTETKPKNVALLYIIRAE